VDVTNDLLTAGFPRRGQPVSRARPAGIAGIRTTAHTRHPAPGKDGAVRTLALDRDDTSRRYRTLPVLLLVLTVVTGLVDAVSYLALGRVFVANMTGNVVFIGFALAGAHGLSVTASLAALGAFLVGAAAGGRAAVRYGPHRGRHLALNCVVTGAVVAAALIISILYGSLPTGARYGVTVLLAVAMGFQNATARRIAVPDATTTVLTLTLTGLAADAGPAGGRGMREIRRFAAVLAMFSGALIGAVLLLHVHRVWWPLALATALLAAVAVTALTLASGTPAEHWAKN
jgi:uncharacterized membrane protein YoaK (UPF0700 family)